MTFILAKFIIVPGHIYLLPNDLKLQTACYQLNDLTHKKFLIMRIIKLTKTGFKIPVHFTAS